MTKEEQFNFVEELIDSVKRDIFLKIPDIPDEWDGVELRWIIKEMFDQVVFGGYQDKRVRRYREFWNYCVVNNI